MQTSQSASAFLTLLFIFDFVRKFRVWHCGQISIINFEFKLKYDKYLLSYQEEQKSDPIRGIYENIQESYDNTDVLNDYIHLLFDHCNQFEDVYNILCGILSILNQNNT